MCPIVVIFLLARGIRKLKTKPKFINNIAKGQKASIVTLKNTREVGCIHICQKIHIPAMRAHLRRDRSTRHCLIDVVVWCCFDFRKVEAPFGIRGLSISRH
jgi:hypothetical protein